ncbi:uncharacterized protein B0I36DRAFT_311020 [Microdochium trichocladiopsis]|uniref:Uncharacterized protein n=1 Tax=Microdochium trichocladiopsis TaxID=1682393 RepID=A0A9P9BZX9_9PEZI|nr:uncharacterized protein B0I36DRAFT_311020 [Microdochium trichocladiopsis]KAH7040574.1 hypothetical protein B0I36DRAFT_311020 [Microdochium trichocladiopsis]
MAIHFVRAQNRFLHPEQQKMPAHRGGQHPSPLLLSVTAQLISWVPECLLNMSQASCDRHHQPPSYQPDAPPRRTHSSPAIHREDNNILWGHHPCSYSPGQQGKGGGARLLWSSIVRTPVTCQFCGKLRPQDRVEPCSLSLFRDSLVLPCGFWFGVVVRQVCGFVFFS